MRTKITLSLVVTAILIVCSPTLAGCAGSSKIAISSVTDNSTKTGRVDVVVAGYINHGPMQSTVQAIKDVLSEYGDKVNVTWVDLDTAEGADYFRQHTLSAHMNVIVNGSYEYTVDGKGVVFQWFEGQQWSKQDFETVVSSLISS